MKSRDLTIKQQAAAKKKFIYVLKLLGFQQADVPLGTYWWKVINKETRVCVGYGMRDLCLGGTTGWAWQTSKPNEEPMFGFSGTTTVGDGFATYDRLLSITLEHFYHAGIAQGAAYHQKRIADVKEKFGMLMKSLNDSVNNL